jgi:hypothetical protein
MCSEGEGQAINSSIEIKNKGFAGILPSRSVNLLIKMHAGRPPDL